MFYEQFLRFMANVDPNHPSVVEDSPRLIRNLLSRLRGIEKPITEGVSSASWMFLPFPFALASHFRPFGHPFPFTFSSAFLGNVSSSGREFPDL